MNWIQCMQNAISYIEKNITDELDINKVAASVNSSSANFQRIFCITAGMTIGEYIRNRRLTLAAQEINQSKEKIVDIAMKYGYETAESFTKAFIRFHGITPTEARKSGEHIKHFAPLSIHVDIKGGFNMQRKVISSIPVIEYNGDNAAFFSTLLNAALAGIGEECDKSKLAALSGEANRFCWTDSAWVFGNEVIQSINENPFDTEYRILSAIGWKAKYITVQRDSNGGFMNIDRAQIRQDFVCSIDRGYPVIIRYIDHSDCDMNIFFGYENNGQKIIGYNYNNNFEPGVSLPVENDIPTSWENWEDNLSGYILLQNKVETASERTTALAGFKAAVKHAHSKSEIRGKKLGHAAWEAFLSHLEFDDFSDCALLSADAPTVNHIAHSLEHRFFIYCDALSQIYARMEGLHYYKALANSFPEWSEELTATISCLHACASYGGFLWSQGFTFEANGFEKFRSKEARKILADAGREAMKKDMEAIVHFENILAKSQE